MADEAWLGRGGPGSSGVGGGGPTGSANRKNAAPGAKRAISLRGKVGTLSSKCGPGYLSLTREDSLPLSQGGVARAGTVPACSAGWGVARGGRAATDAEGDIVHRISYRRKLSPSVYSYVREQRGQLGGRVQGRSALPVGEKALGAAVADADANGREDHGPGDGRPPGLGEDGRQEQLRAGAAPSGTRRAPARTPAGG
jgi:hypothetical protein